MANVLIYLFEDDESLRSLLDELLAEELGARVLACSSFADLRQACEVESPSVIVADFWGASHAYLSDDEREQITSLGKIAPLILVSARQWAQDVETSNLGLAAVIGKPLDLDGLVGVVRQAIATQVEGGLTADELAAEQAEVLPPREALSVFLISG